MNFLASQRTAFLHKDKYIISYLIHIPTYKVKTFAFFATFCSGKKLNKKIDKIKHF